MAIRGMYEKWEEETIALNNKRYDECVGWKQYPNRVATEDSIIRFGRTVDYRNPLWHDWDYASGTRWGGIIAAPCYQGRFGGGTPGMRFPEDCGIISKLVRIGENWEFFKPVRPGDSFRTWSRRPQLKDVTSLDGNGPRKFGLMEWDLDHINQKDELVSKTVLRVEITLFPETQEIPIQNIPKYKYSREELDYIEETSDGERIRGNEPRYWEEVNIGDRPTPIILGPTTVLDAAAQMSTGSMLPLDPVEVRKVQIHGTGFGGSIPSPSTGLHRFAGLERHFLDEAAQEQGAPTPRGFHFAVQGRAATARLATNWMGNDGFLRKFDWRHIELTPVGDTLIGKGLVVNKRIENGEYLVDMHVWLEDLRGFITEVAVATVSLLSAESKESPYTWK